MSTTMSAAQQVMRYNHQAMSYLSQDNLELAKVALDKAEALADKGQMDDGIEQKKMQSTTFNNLSCYYTREGNWDEALRYCTRAFNIEKNDVPSSTPADLATAHLNMCAILSRTGKHRGAVKHGRAAIEKLEEQVKHNSNYKRTTSSIHQRGKVVNGDNPYSLLAIAYHNLSTELRYCKDFGGAKQAIEEAKRLSMKHLGNHHPTTAVILNAYMSDFNPRLAKKTRTLVVTKTKIAGSAVPKEGETASNSEHAPEPKKGISRSTAVKPLRRPSATSSRRKSSQASRQQPLQQPPHARPQNMEGGQMAAATMYQEYNLPAEGFTPYQVAPPQQPHQLQQQAASWQNQPPDNMGIHEIRNSWDGGWSNPSSQSPPGGAVPAGSYAAATQHNDATTSQYTNNVGWAESPQYQQGYGAGPSGFYPQGQLHQQQLQQFEDSMGGGISGWDDSVQLASQLPHSEFKLPPLPGVALSSTHTFSNLLPPTTGEEELYYNPQQDYIGMNPEMEMIPQAPQTLYSRPPPNVNPLYNYPHDPLTPSGQHFQSEQRPFTHPMSKQLHPTPPSAVPQGPPSGRPHRAFHKPPTPELKPDTPKDSVLETQPQPKSEVDVPPSGTFAPRPPQPLDSHDESTSTDGLKQYVRRGLQGATPKKRKFKKRKKGKTAMGDSPTAGPTGGSPEGSDTEGEVVAAPDPDSLNNVYKLNNTKSVNSKAPHASLSSKSHSPTSQHTDNITGNKGLHPHNKSEQRVGSSNSNRSHSSKAKPTTGAKAVGTESEGEHNKGKEAMVSDEVVTSDTNANPARGEQGGSESGEAAVGETNATTTKGKKKKKKPKKVKPNLVTQNVQTYKEEHKEVAKRNAKWLQSTICALQKERDHRDKSSACIQRAWRCACAKLEMYNRKQVLYNYVYKVQQKAALIIQLAVRKWIAITTAGHRRDAVYHAINERCSRECKEDEAAAAIQRVWMMYRAKQHKQGLQESYTIFQREVQFLRESNSIKHIQRWYRRIRKEQQDKLRKAKQQATLKEAKKMQRQLTNAATSIQSLWKGHRDRKIGKMKHAEYFMQQQKEKGHKSSAVGLITIFLREMRARQRRLALQGERQQHQENEAAAKIQNVYRHQRYSQYGEEQLKRQRAATRNQHVAARQIQRAYRGYCGRRQAQELKLSVQQKENEHRQTVLQHNRVDSAAQVIQRGWKCCMARRIKQEKEAAQIHREVTRKNSAAVLVQNNWRRHSARQLLDDKKKEKEFQLQSKQTDEVRQREDEAAVKIQSAIKGKVARDQYKSKVKEAREAKEDLLLAHRQLEDDKQLLPLICLLQRVGRGLAARHQLMEYLKYDERYYAESNKAATRIQSMYRGRVARHEFGEKMLKHREGEEAILVYAQAHKEINNEKISSLVTEEDESRRTIVDVEQIEFGGLSYAHFQAIMK